jgi:hypothetical protein
MVEIRNAVRTPEFDAQTEALAAAVDRAKEIIDGAVWEIAKRPTELGVFIDSLGVWQARLTNPPVLLLYCINRRFVHMLAMIPSDDTLSL